MTRATFHPLGWLLILAGLGSAGCGSSDGPPAPASDGGQAGSGQSGGGKAAGGAASAGGPASGGKAGSSSGGSSGSGGGVSGAAGATGQEPPGIQYFGRWERLDGDSMAASWGAVGLKARFQGTSVRLKLTDANNTFTYSIDGAPHQKLVASASGETALGGELPDGEHTLELFRRSEGSYGKTVFAGLVLDAGKKLLSPPPRPARKLEVLGDSISAGFGNEGMGGSTPDNQNGYLAYGPQLARMLGAEWSIVAHSGQGMYRNLCEPLPPTGLHMPDEFLLTHHPAVPGPQWSFDGWQPDVLVVALGTNDFSDYPPGSCAAPDVAAFRQAYAGFLQLARSKYPNAEIFALGTFNAALDNPLSTANDAICAVVDEAAQTDSRLHCLDPSLGSEGAWLVGPDDYIGDWTHPTVAGHTKIADKLAAVIKSTLGW